ncbi:MAG TPA: penicillin-binding transpeptidase domain-containing protein, partial [Chitinophagaceae bacterium]|nr:penicillin-binding transpeptidase domain-containing protein [Chitinophagaceae bacterium]
ENQTIDDTVFLGKYKVKHSVTKIPDDMFEAVHDAMQDVTEYGTAAGAQIEGINFCAKTGTAQNPHGKNHSLFVAFAPREDPQIAIAVVVENAGFGATWAAPIASLMMERYLKDSLSAERLARADQISKADLIPAAIKHWYYTQDSIKLAKLAKQIDADNAPVIENKVEDRKNTFDPEAEPNRKDSSGSDTEIKKQPAVIPPKQTIKKPGGKNG